MSVAGKYEAVIGLETHVQLATRTKIFSPAAAEFGEEPNTRTDPLVLALPGTLPVLNRAVVQMAIRFGLAVGGHIRPRCRFARKHYFYPDLPKGYQISQFDEPIVEGGTVSFRLHGERRQVRLTRIHLEEDAGKNIHGDGGTSFVDYNRAGVPLCEVVSEPELRSADEAAEYLRAVRTLVRYLGISDGNMEEGSLRCDANVSIRPRGQQELGTKAELKNINSFKNVKDAIEHEIKRQIACLERGERIVQETRLWDAARGVSASMRSKEAAHDYRYFPEPDLPPVVTSAADLAAARETLPELPEDRFARYSGALGLPAQDAGVLVAEKEIADYYDAAVLAAGGEAHGKKIANWVINEVLGRVTDARTLAAAEVPVPAPALAELYRLIDTGTLSGKQGKEVFGRMWLERRSAGQIVAAEGMSQVSDTGALEQVCQRVIAASPDEVGRFKGGQVKLMGFFVGQVMKETGGKANPKAVNEILTRLLA
jgi:aspartyl-tRNA(Asn)/glutamyl-tRNA(Gln) amidotransferase subunit B